MYHAYSESSKRLRQFIDLLSENTSALKVMQFPVYYGTSSFAMLSYRNLIKFLKRNTRGKIIINFLLKM